MIKIKEYVMAESLEQAYELNREFFICRHRVQLIPTIMLCALCTRACFVKHGLQS